MRRSNCSPAFQLNSRWPKRASLRRPYSKGVRVASGCCGHQWNQVEINEMVLNVGKGDLRGLSQRPPGPSKQDPPLSSGDWSSPAPPPCPQLRVVENPLTDPRALQIGTPLHPVTAVSRGGTKTRRRTFAPCPGALGGREVPEGCSGVSDGILGRSKTTPVQSEVFGLKLLQIHSKYWMAPGEVSNPGNREAPGLET